MVVYLLSFKDRISTLLRRKATSQRRLQSKTIQNLTQYVLCKVPRNMYIIYRVSPSVTSCKICVQFSVGVICVWPYMMERTNKI